MSKNGNANGANNEVTMVTLTIDDQEVTVPAGTNLIEAAKARDVEVPYYCYHPHLSVPGNCRMCQVEVEGAPKLVVGCATPVRDGMVVRTHETSKKVADTQASTLELILINHPLDCTVCDQAGHCKLQDYHYEYNGKPSRFLENKEKKVKAEPLGPNVILDGERCIMCTRCIRFCDEVTGTSELGMLNRGDKSVIAIDPDNELDNALSGTVVDLCPVGALTHRKWRFNTRIWYTDQVNTICPGCSTGCNVKVAMRDEQVVQVKARQNDEVNKEWLCDEGRYGFERFLPKNRLRSPYLEGVKIDWEQAISELRGIKDKEPLVLVAPDLLLEEYALLKKYLDTHVKKYLAVVAYKERELSDVEKVLVSPDYAANYQGAVYCGLVDGDLEDTYKKALGKIKVGACQSLMLFGDRAIDSRDLDTDVLNGFKKIGFTAASLTDADSPLAEAVNLVLPGRSILEKSGLMVNRRFRLQYTDQLTAFPVGSEPEWRLINVLAKNSGGELVSAQTERDLSIQYLQGESRLQGLRLKEVKKGGVDLTSYTSPESSDNVEEQPSAQP